MLIVMLRYVAEGLEDDGGRHRGGMPMTNQAYRHDYEESPAQDTYRPDLVPDTKPQLDYSPSDRSVSLCIIINIIIVIISDKLTQSTFIDQP